VRQEQVGLVYVGTLNRFEGIILSIKKGASSSLFYYTEYLFLREFNKGIKSANYGHPKIHENKPSY
jgi:hypothetical protein